MSALSSKNCELLRKYVKEGSRAAIGEFLQNYTDLFYRVAWKYVKNDADADDIIQNSFLTILAKANQYKGIETNEEKLLTSWCLSIVVNCALKKLRSDNIHKKNEDFLKSIYQEDFEAEEAMENDKKKIQLKIQEEILLLPEKYRIPIHLRYIENFDLESISQILKINSNTLRSNIKRGLDKISEKLRRENITLSSVALAGFIQEMPLPKTPAYTKTLAQKTISKLDKMPNSIMKTMSSHSIWQTVLIFTSVISVAIGGFWLLQYKTTHSSAINIKPQVKLKEPEQDIGVSSKTIASEYEGYILKGKEYLAPVKFLVNSMEYYEKLEMVAAKPDDVTMFLMPITPRSKPFVIESTIMILTPKDFNAKTIINYAYGAWWVKEQKVSLAFKKTYNKIDLNKVGSYKQKIYFSNNRIIVFINDLCTSISEYSELKNENIVFYAKNIGFRDIQIKNLEKLPEVVNKEIDKLKQAKDVFIEENKEWKIDPKTFYFY